jgi:isocitrate dehydrogenase
VGLRDGMALARVSGSFPIDPLDASLHFGGMSIPITVAYGDGIGPEIMEATLQIIQEAGAELEVEKIEIGEKVYLAGHPAGIEPAAWDSLRRTKVFLKGPVTTPPGNGFKSLNMTARKALGLYANVRPSLSYHPYVDTRHPKMDLVVVRESEEDVYAGIEYRQTTDLVHALKLISRPGSERIIRYAFEYAQTNGRKKVTCFTRENILKMSDGLFHEIFDEIGVHYPEIEKEHAIFDSGVARLADTPEQFDVLVLPNSYGDTVSEIAAQIAGSVGLASSSSIGTDHAMFEAIHGSAPRRAGQNVANPSGLFLGGVLMLVHIGQTEPATRAHNAWLKTIEDGIHTYDMFKEGISKQKVGTKEFTKAVIERLGQAPSKLKAVAYKSGARGTSSAYTYRRPVEAKQLVGVDVLIEFIQGAPEDLARILQPLEGDGLKLETIANRGMTLWPQGHAEAFCTDSFACRFKLPDDAKAVLPHRAVVALLDRIATSGVEFLRTELLYQFDGKPGFTRGQGE